MREDQCNKVSHTGLYDCTTACTRAARANAPNTVYWCQEPEVSSGAWWSDCRCTSSRSTTVWGAKDLSPESGAGMETG